MPNDAANLSLEAIREGVKRGEYVEIPNVPIFDAHDEHDANGQLVRRFDYARLDAIAQHCNRRAAVSGDLIPFGPGHTLDNVPETQQPPIYGFASGCRVDKFGPGQKLGILATLYAKREHAADVKQNFPRRSVELWYRDNLIDWIALLRRSPQRDLGLLAYSRDAYTAGQKRFCPWDSNPQVFAADRRTVVAAAMNDKGKLRYSLEHAMPMDPTMPPNVNASPDQGTPGAPSFSPEDGEKALAYFKHLHGKYAAEGAGGPPPGGPPGAPPGLPGANNGMPPLPGANPEDDKLRMQRESQAIHTRTIEQRLADAEAQLAAERARYERSEVERQIVQLEGEGYNLKRAEEVEFALSLPPQQRAKNIQRIRDNYQKDLTRGVHSRFARTPDPTPSGGDQYAAVGGKAAHEKAMQYMRAHPGMSMQEALEKTK